MSNQIQMGKILPPISTNDFEKFPNEPRVTIFSTAQPIKATILSFLNVEEQSNYRSAFPPLGAWSMRSRSPEERSDWYRNLERRTKETMKEVIRQQEEVVKDVLKRIRNPEDDYANSNLLDLIPNKNLIIRGPCSIYVLESTHDDKLLSLFRRCPGLVALKIEANMCNSDKSITKIKNLKKLTSLDLNLSTAHITDGGLSCLAKLPKLKELTLSNDGRVTGRFMIQSKNMANLEYLTLDHCNLFSHLNSLTELPKIRHIKLLNLPNFVDNRIFSALKRMPLIQSIRMSWLDPSIPPLSWVRGGPDPIIHWFAPAAAPAIAGPAPAAIAARALAPVINNPPNSPSNRNQVVFGLFAITFGLAAGVYAFLDPNS